jgi:hypothetical protein
VSSICSADSIERYRPCWTFVNEYKLPKRAIYRTPPKRGSHFWVHGDARPGADRISSLTTARLTGAAGKWDRHGGNRIGAVITSRRSEVLPELPTVAEFVPGYEMRGWDRRAKGYAR